MYTPCKTLAFFKNAWSHIMHVTLPFDSRPTTSRVGSWEATVVVVLTNKFSIISTTAGGRSFRSILVSFSADNFSDKSTTSWGSFGAVVVFCLEDKLFWFDFLGILKVPKSGGYTNKKIKSNWQ